MVPFIKPPIFLVKAPVVTTGLVGESITPKPAKTGLGLKPTTIPDAVTAGKLFGAIVPASVTADDVIFDFVPVKTTGAAVGGGVKVYVNPLGGKTVVDRVIDEEFNVPDAEAVQLVVEVLLLNIAFDEPLNPT